MAAGLSAVSMVRRHCAAFVAAKSSAHLNEELLKQKELDYVVDGAISGNGTRFQISVRLLDVTQFACPVWSDRFELAIDELHRLDDGSQRG